MYHLPKLQDPTSDLRLQLYSTLGSTCTLESELDGGGMRRVFVAEDKSLGWKVVVRVLRPEMAAGVNVDRIRREIQLAASLRHPHSPPRRRRLIQPSALLHHALYRRRVALGEGTQL